MAQFVRKKAKRHPFDIEHGEGEQCATTINTKVVKMASPSLPTVASYQANRRDAKRGLPGSSRGLSTPRRSSKSNSTATKGTKGFSSPWWLLAGEDHQASQGICQSDQELVLSKVAAGTRVMKTPRPVISVNIKVHPGLVDKGVQGGDILGQRNVDPLLP